MGSPFAALATIVANSGMEPREFIGLVNAHIRTLYNPSIGFGGKIKVESSLIAANGVYSVYGLHHHLACEMPDGPWFSTINGYAPTVNLPSGVVKRPATGPV